MNLDELQLIPTEQPPDWEIHSVDGVFIKRMGPLKRGDIVPQHAHEHDHCTLLAVGSVQVYVEGAYVRTVEAPSALYIKRDQQHAFRAMEDGTIAYCIHNLHGKEEVGIIGLNMLTKET